MSMELLFDREANAKERLAFVRTYAAWVKRTPNAEWSRQQAVLIDSFFENARNMPLSPRDYLLAVAGRKKNSRQDPSLTAREPIDARYDPPH
jgi:hypothetical protein